MVPVWIHAKLYEPYCTMYGSNMFFLCISICWTPRVMLKPEGFNDPEVNFYFRFYQLLMLLKRTHLEIIPREFFNVSFPNVVRHLNLNSWNLKLLNQITVMTYIYIKCLGQYTLYTISARMTYILGNMNPLT